jgi:hypothetical protein
MAIKQIKPGAPPILWSSVDNAFKDINDNFTELALSVGLGGVVDLTALNSTIGPADDNTFDLGQLTDKWRDLYLSQSIYLGNGRILAEGDSINLPAGATIGNSGQLLDEKYFKTISVSGQTSVEPDQITDTLNLNTGTGVSILTNNSTNTITFSNTGVTSLLSGIGINVSASTGAITVNNAGVTSLSGTAGQIGVSSSTGSVVLTNLGVTQLTTDPGSGIGISASTGVINITNLAPNISQNVFRNINVFGQSVIEASGIADTLRLSPGYGIIITTVPTTNTINFELNQNIDISGSVFADDSSPMVDAVDQRVFASGGIFGNLTGNVSGDVTGNLTGNVSGDVTGNLTGNVSGNVTGNVTGNLTGNVTGDTVGYHTGDVTGSLFSDSSTLLVDGVNGVLVGPVDTTTVSASGLIQGNEIEATTRLITPVIESSDSSAITVIPAVIFNSDVTVENELIVNNIPGYIKLDLLKSVVAASTDFLDFQSRIAAL